MLRFIGTIGFDLSLRRRTLVWILAVATFFPLGLWAQTASLTGLVRDKSTNETLIGAAVLVKGTTNGSSTDLDGKYLISGINPGKVTLVVQYLGYNPLEVTGVMAVAGKTERMDLYLVPSSTALSEVKVEAEALKTTVSAIQLMQKNSASLMDGTSSDQIKKSPDRNTADVLKRSSGTTIQDGKYAIVRGLNERYNLALVNGAMLPGSEPDKKVFSFDIFPAGMLDNLIIIKTAQPDLPGEFAGGIIRINTKDVPDSNFLSISASGGMNTQATFQNFRRVKGSSTDWLGYDNGQGEGTRVLPKDWPTNREQLLNQSVTSRAQRFELSKQFSNTFQPKESNALPYGGFQLSGGLRKTQGNNEFGMIGGMNYTLSQRVNYQQVNGWAGVNGRLGDSTSFNSLLNTFQDTVFSNEISWGTLLNFSARLGASNRLYLKNAFNITSDQIYTNGQGYRTENGEFENFRRHQLEFTSNRLLTSQLGGEHSLNKNKFRLDWTGSLSQMNRDQPDFRRVRFNGNEVNSGTDSATIVWRFNPNSTANNTDGYRFFASMTETVGNAVVNLTVPFQWNGHKHEFKTGFYAQSKQREFIARALGYATSGGVFDPRISLMGLDSVFGDWNMRENGLWMDEITNPSDRYRAESRLLAGYLMMTNRLGPKTKAIWGLRYEDFTQQLIAPTDVELTTFDTTTNKFPTLLPSLNLVHSLNESSNLRFAFSRTLSRPEFREIAPFAFYDFDLFATTYGNDSLIQATIYNVDLRYEIFQKMGQMFSAGVFYKLFQNPIEQFFPAAVGSGLQRGLSWLNSPDANTFGVELVVRRNLEALSMWGLGGFWKDMALSSNMALIRSEIVIPYSDTTRGKYLRPMQGQSPFIFNVALQYSNSERGLQCNLLYNQIGRRVAFVGAPDVNLADYYENSRPLVDLQLSKNWGRATLTVSISDLFNLPRYIYLDQNSNGRLDKELYQDAEKVGVQKPNLEYRADRDAVILRSQPGRTASVGFSYRL
jgi:TonB-dependent receptor